MFGLFRSFAKDVRGVSTLMLGLALPGLMLAVGGGIDLSQAASRRQRIASAVELGCQHASQEVSYQKRQSGADPNKDYTSVVNQITMAKVNDSDLSGITGAGVTSTIVNDVITIRATAASTNAFGGILGYQTVSLGVQRSCNVAAAAAPGKVLFAESFETGHNIATNSWGVLKNWNGWTTPSGKGGIEINGIPSLAANEIRFGNFFAELDSHCYTSGCSTNSIMYRDITAPENGAYELRYWYISRVRNPAYGNQIICATKSATANWWTAVDWANWEGYTNKIEVYFDKSTATIQTVTKSNLVDVCVHTAQWTERVIKFPNLVKNTSYRMYFRADGREDTYGGLIDYIRFCSGTCP